MDYQIYGIVFDISAHYAFVKKQNEEVDIFKEEFIDSLDDIEISESKWIPKI